MVMRAQGASWSGGRSLVRIGTRMKRRECESVRVEVYV
jgi:hypothetical protein